MLLGSVVIVTIPTEQPVQTAQPAQTTIQSNHIGMCQNMIHQNLSIMITNVFPNCDDEETIIRAFHEQQIGKVFKVSITRMSFGKNKKKPVYKAIVHFSVWYDTKNAYNLQQRIFNEKKVRVVYNGTWFWNVFENKSSRLSNTDKRSMRIAADIYKIQQENFHIQNKISHIAADNAYLFKIQNEAEAAYMDKFQIAAENDYMIKNKLFEQNQRIQELQDVCIANGLEVPFWVRNNPPSADVSSMELLSAKTAIAAANFVLDEPNNNDTATSTSTSTMNCQETEDFIPVGRYENDNTWADNTEWENDPRYDEYYDYDDYYDNYYNEYFRKATFSD